MKLFEKRQSHVNNELATNDQYANLEQSVRWSYSTETHSLTMEHLSPGHLVCERSGDIQHGLICGFL